MMCGRIAVEVYMILIRTCCSMSRVYDRNSLDESARYWGLDKLTLNSLGSVFRSFRVPLLVTSFTYELPFSSSPIPSVNIVNQVITYGAPGWYEVERRTGEQLGRGLKINIAKNCPPHESKAVGGQADGTSSAVASRQVKQNSRGINW